MKNCPEGPIPTADMPLVVGLADAEVGVGKLGIIGNGQQDVYIRLLIA